MENYICDLCYKFKAIEKTQYVYYCETFCGRESNIYVCYPCSIRIKDILINKCEKILKYLDVDDGSDDYLSYQDDLRCGELLCDIKNLLKIYNDEKKLSCVN